MSDYQTTLRETEHISIEALADGQRRIKEYLIANMPTNVATREQWEEIFSPNNPANVAPSSDVAGSVAYSRPGCEKWNHAKRQRTSLGRYLGRNCKLSVGDVGCQRVIDEAIASICDIYPIALQFELLRGDAILKAYREGIGCHSCMTGNHSKIQDRLKMYSDNPNNVALLVWRKTRGRALLWTLDCGEKYLDRIYSGDYSGAPVAYGAYCDANGIRFSYESLLGCDLASASVTLDYHGFNSPYLDSFRFRRRGSIVTLTLNGPECHVCGCDISDDDCYTVDDRTICSDCYSEHYFHCSDCDHVCDRDYYVDFYNTVANAVAVCDECLSSNYFRCVDCSEYHSNDDENRTDHDESVCNGCAENYVTCNCCNKLVRTS